MRSIKNIDPFKNDGKPGNSSIQFLGKVEEEKTFHVIKLSGLVCVPDLNKIFGYSHDTLYLSLADDNENYGSFDKVKDFDKKNITKIKEWVFLVFHI